MTSSPERLIAPGPPCSALIDFGGGRFNPPGPAQATGSLPGTQPASSRGGDGSGVRVPPGGRRAGRSGGPAGKRVKRVGCHCGNKPPMAGGPGIVHPRRVESAGSGTGEHRAAVVIMLCDQPADFGPVPGPTSPPSTNPSGRGIVAAEFRGRGGGSGAVQPGLLPGACGVAGRPGRQANHCQTCERGGVDSIAGGGIRPRPPGRFCPSGEFFWGNISRPKGRRPKRHKGGEISGHQPSGWVRMAG